MRNGSYLKYARPIAPPTTPINLRRTATPIRFLQQQKICEVGKLFKQFIANLANRYIRQSKIKRELISALAAVFGNNSRNPCHNMICSVQLRIA